MRFPMEVLKCIVWGEVFPEGYENIKVIEEGEWIDDGKTSYATFVFEFKEKFYCYTAGRSGSYHAEYYFDWEWSNAPKEIPEVRQVEKTVLVWEKV